MERKLPIIQIEGTDFIVDVIIQELREAANPENSISFLEMKDDATHYTFQYDPKEKNLPDFFNKGKTVSIPQMVELDPVGMAEQFGLKPEEIAGKADFDLIVNQDLVDQRLKGTLPVIDIAGHPFFVDIRMGSLRPKDDFSTQGILLDEIDHCLNEDENAYLITYNPDKKSFAEIDFQKITSIPEKIILVEIPFQSTLDPIGYARKIGIDPKQLLRSSPPEQDMKARIVPWAETPIKEIINQNLRNAAKPARKRGPRL